MAKFKARIPAGRFARPEEIAHLAVYLASDEVGTVFIASLASYSDLAIQCLFYMQKVSGSNIRITFNT